MYILGISCFYHDSAAVLIRDGDILAGVQEERFTRKKNDASFPVNSIKYILKEANISPSRISLVSFYEKPYRKFNRILTSWFKNVPYGEDFFLHSFRVWILNKKIFLADSIKSSLTHIGLEKFDLIFPEHHLSHAASAFYPSPYGSSAIITLDGVGEWATTAIGYGVDNKIEILKEILFPNSLGLLYSAFTQYCGFEVNEGEYKLMGLSSYGDRDSDQFSDYYSKILNELINIKNDGSFCLNMEYFDYSKRLRICNYDRWEKLFKIPPRQPGSAILNCYMNLSLAIQTTVERVIFALAKTAKKITRSKNLTIAGGVGLNCVSNGKLLSLNIFDKIWVQPAAGDAGGSLGAALAAWHIFEQKPRIAREDENDNMKGSLIGPHFDRSEILNFLKRYELPFYSLSDDEIDEIIAHELKNGRIIGLFRGRMEFGPRSLGNRSIIGNPCIFDTQKKMNLKIKNRESFRPFAPAVLFEDLDKYFELDRKSPYMLFVSSVLNSRRREVQHSNELMERLYHIRSDIPAVTHVDFSSRIQTVHKDINPRFWNTINSFKKLTGYGIIVNTSFNVKGEPIVCTPKDALECFIKTAIDFLVLENFFVKKPR